MPNTFKPRISLVGPARAGKTTLIQKYDKNLFRDDYIATMGAEYIIKEIKKADVILQLYIWDVAGNPEYRGFQDGIAKWGLVAKSQCILICFDMQDYRSFTYAIEEEYREFKKINPEAAFVLVGLKMDLVEGNLPPFDDEVRVLVKEEGLPCIYTSSKEGTNVDECFDLVLNLCLEKIKL
ncbi:MAG: Rab family GTPase [Candidatus Hodarchaeota archaeon]